MQTAARSAASAPGSLVLNIQFMFLLSLFSFALRRPWRALSAIWITLTASSILIVGAFIGLVVEKKHQNIGMF